ncbi:MAG: HNH endonuclease [Elusimicrobia bacterium]|nr:HNH endonuclease [Elusimicrobiota bacterium]
MERGDALIEDCRRLSNADLLRDLAELSARERSGLVRVLARLSEMDVRELAEEQGFSSLYLFCLRKLRYCEATAWRRTKAAEACRRFTFIFDLIEDGDISVTAVALLAQHLTRENCRRLISQAKGRSSRDVERLVASLSPQARPPAERVTFIAVAKDGAASSRPSAPAGPAGADVSMALPCPSREPAPRPVEVPAIDALQAALVFASGAAGAPDIELRSKRTFTCTEHVERMIGRARELLWHKHPEGRFEDILSEALEALLDRLERPKRASRPRLRRGGAARPGAPARRSRAIPRWVKEEVRKRDGEQCSFIGPAGRCPERSGLEYDHIVPFADGGPSDDPKNIRRACRAHNQWRARKRFGARVPCRRARDVGAGTTRTPESAAFAPP